MHLRIFGFLILFICPSAGALSFESSLPQVSFAGGVPSQITQVRQLVVPGQGIGGQIEQVPEDTGRLISLSKFSAATRVLQTPISPQDLTVRYGSPVKGEGLIIGNGADALYVAPGSGAGFGYIPYGYGN